MPEEVTRAVGYNFNDKQIIFVSPSFVLVTKSFAILAIKNTNLFIAHPSNTSQQNNINQSSDSQQ
jgi:hypothetical protein